MQTLRLTGKVVQGTGEGAKFLGLEWVKKQIQEKLGFMPFPGTLNVKLASSSMQSWNMLMTAQSMEIAPARGHCRGKIFAAHVNDMECGVVVPLVVGYSEDLVEVVAPFSLRKKLALADGDSVEIEVTF